MALRGEQDNLPYRSPLTETAPPAPVTTNEQEYSTLKIVQRLLSEAVQGLSKDFNALEVLRNEDPEAAAKNLLRQVEVKQDVYDILAPLLETVNNALQVVDNKYKQR